MMHNDAAHKGEGAVRRAGWLVVGALAVGGVASACSAPQVIHRRAAPPLCRLELRRRSRLPTHVGIPQHGLEDVCRQESVSQPDHSRQPW
jgi:hypothetical protein